MQRTAIINANMKKTSVVILGTSGHTKVVIDILEKQNQYTIFGLLKGPDETITELLGYPIIGVDSDLPGIIKSNPGLSAIIGVGDNWLRYKIKGSIETICPGIEFISAIHPSAQIGKNVTIGKGVIIMAGVIINPGCKVDDFTLLNTKSSLDHDSHMHTFSSLAPNSCVGGDVSIGEFSAVSIGANIKNGVTIGKHAVIGGGSMLLTNCNDNTVMYGVPAKFIRARKAGEKYM